MWRNPLPYDLAVTADSMSFDDFPEGYIGLPIGQHVGAFAFQRKNHTHEGVDLYVPEGTPVSAVEDGLVVAVLRFTGPSAEPPSPWWHDTEAVLVEGQSGVVLYGEVNAACLEGDLVRAGDLLGHVTQVLTRDKGRPMTMLHMELHQPSTRDAQEWLPDGEKPASLLDPTPYLLRLAAHTKPPRDTPAPALA